MSKSDRYTSSKGSNGADDLEDLSNRLTSDLRRNIRQLGSYPLFSRGWLSMAEICGRIASVSDRESSLSSSKDDGTLWETEEQALRFMLEDGKLNVCLRSMIQYKECHCNIDNENSSNPLIEYQSQCDQFEQGLGSVLKNAWNHIEAIQTTDIVSLIDHIANVLNAPFSNQLLLKIITANDDLYKRQEVLVFYYLCSILKGADDLGENRIMPSIRQQKVFMSAVNMMELIHTKVLSVHVLKMIEALSLLVETEDYSTYRDKYISSPEELERVINLQTICIAEYNKDMSNRKITRPFMEAIDKAKRNLKFK